MAAAQRGETCDNPASALEVSATEAGAVGASAVEPLVAEDLESSADNSAERSPRPSIRLYRPEDREAIRHICCETGFGGRPVEGLFSDRELFADFLTRYYTDFEPESILVGEHGGKVVGYLTGCLRYRYHRVVQLWIGAVVGAKALWRLARGRYDRASRAYVAWCFLRAHREIPPGPPRSGHFHSNVLPDYREWLGMRLFWRFVGTLGKRAPRLYLRVEAPAGRRSDRLFERYGFPLLDRRRISRFTGRGEPVYVSVYARGAKPRQDGPAPRAGLRRR
jgi:hypothetical protein